MFGCFKTLSVRISLLICKFSESKLCKNSNPSLSHSKKKKDDSKCKNLKRDIEATGTRLVDDFDGKRLARNNIRSEFDFCRVPFTKRSPKLVFPNTHSFRHHPKFQTHSKNPLKWLKREEDKKWELSYGENNTRLSFTSFFSLLGKRMYLWVTEKIIYFCKLFMLLSFYLYILKLLREFSISRKHD